MKTELELLANDRVNDLHHFHIWSLDGQRNVMSVHLLLKGKVSVEQIKSLKRSVQTLLQKYHFEHTTVELEFADEQSRVQSAKVRFTQTKSRPDIEWSAGIRRIQGIDETAFVAGVSVLCFKSNEIWGNMKLKMPALLKSTTFNMKINCL